MFTGIIEEVGKISNIGTSGDLRAITIQCKKLQQDMVLGASVSCNGICLTVTRFDDKSISVSIMPETMKKTTAHQWGIGTFINLERALTLQSRLDGHLVQGHIDTVTTVRKITQKNKTSLVTLQLPRDYEYLAVEQGSIAVDGVSLTISSLAERFFSVSLVEFTLQNTNLKNLKPGSRVNLEFDIVGKYLQRRIMVYEKRLSEEYIDEISF